MGHLHSGLTYDKSPFQRKVLYFQGMKVDISQLSISYQTLRRIAFSTSWPEEVMLKP